MVNVIGVRFPNAGKLYYFNPGPYWPSPGDYVIVETIHGLSLGEVVMPVHETDEELLTAPLKVVTRIANEEDLLRDRENHQLEKQAEAIALEKIKAHKLPMKLVGTEYTFDRAKVIFYFTADGRVDFRALVRDLSAAMRPRIELRQIGVRDEARMMGGLGPCGRPICCSSFLGDFQPVSIKMAKSQNLSMNPAKISGICGKLMCCIKFEEETYERILKEMPPVNSRITTPDGPGTVASLFVAREAVRVRIRRGDTEEMRDYSLADLKECNPQWKSPQPPKAPEDASPAEEAEKPARRERHPRARHSAEDCAACPQGSACPAAQMQNAEAPAQAGPDADPAKPEAAPAKPEAAQAEDRPAEVPASPAASWRDKLAQAMKAAGASSEQ